MEGLLVPVFSYVTNASTLLDLYMSGRKIFKLSCYLRQNSSRRNCYFSDEMVEIDYLSELHNISNGRKLVYS